jgi:hypothetical protein
LFFIFKNRSIPLFPQIPRESDQNADFNLPDLFGSCISKVVHPSQKSSFSHKGIITWQLISISNGTPQSLRVVTFCQQMLSCLKVAKTERAHDITRPILLYHIVSCKGFTIQCQPCKEFSFRLYFGLPNIHCRKCGHGASELAVIGRGHTVLPFPNNNIFLRAKGRFLRSSRTR